MLALKGNLWGCLAEASNIELAKSQYEQLQLHAALSVQFKLQKKS